MDMDHLKEKLFGLDKYPTPYFFDMLISTLLSHCFQIYIDICQLEHYMF